MTSGAEGVSGQYHAPNLIPLLPGTVTARHSGPSSDGERLVCGRGMLTPAQRTLIFWRMESFLGSLVRVVPAVKCIMA